MQQILVYAGIALALLTGLAGLLHSIAAFYRARAAQDKDPAARAADEARAQKLEAAEHVLEALVSVEQKREGGESIFQAGLELVESPHGQELARSLLARVNAAPSGPERIG